MKQDEEDYRNFMACKREDIGKLDKWRAGKERYETLLAELSMLNEERLAKRRMAELPLGDCVSKTPHLVMNTMLAQVVCCCCCCCCMLCVVCCTSATCQRHYSLSDATNVFGQATAISMRRRLPTTSGWKIRSDPRCLPFPSLGTLGERFLMGAHSLYSVHTCVLLYTPTLHRGRCRDRRLTLCVDGVLVSDSIQGRSSVLEGLFNLQQRQGLQ